MKLNVSNVIIAHAQVWTYMVALLGFIGLLFVLVLGGSRLDPTSKEIVSTMLNVLGTILAGMTAYFFARQRPDGTGETTREKPPAA